MNSNPRRPATFTIDAPASVKGLPAVRWKVVISESGLTATRSADGHKFSVDWRTLLGTILFYGKAIT